MPGIVEGLGYDLAILIVHRICIYHTLSRSREHVESFSMVWSRIFSCPRTARAQTSLASSYWLLSKNSITCQVYYKQSIDLGTCCKSYFSEVY